MKTPIVPLEIRKETKSSVADNSGSEPYLKSLSLACWKITGTIARNLIPSIKGICLPELGFRIKRSRHLEKKFMAKRFRVELPLKVFSLESLNPSRNCDSGHIVYPKHT